MITIQDAFERFLTRERARREGTVQDTELVLDLMASFLNGRA